MPNEIEIFIRTGATCSNKEAHAFGAMVRSAEQVNEATFPSLFAKAPVVVLASQTSKFVACAALKLPKQSYKAKVFESSNLNSHAEKFSLELGWIVVAPTSRRQGLSRRVSEAAVARKRMEGIYATVRTSNSISQHLLESLGFVKSGDTYPSQSGMDRIGLYLLQSST
jgi:ribosomal protein S18 acetylase RimI-like enzyme